MVRSRQLGQNFLADPNTLEVIVRLADLAPDDVVLEVGGGQGVLSRLLAPRVVHLHVVEIDTRLEADLRAALGGETNVTLHLADALALDLATLDPPPTRMVANLPYAVAATVILRTIEELPGLQRWLVMVQREVGERLAAAPGEPAYGLPSVLAQLACEVRLVRAVPRTVFRPVPRVDSMLVELRRTGAYPDPGTRSLAREAFAHRRKTLAGALALSGRHSADIRQRGREALIALGHPPTARAEELAPHEYVALARRLEDG